MSDAQAAKLRAPQEKVAPLRRARNTNGNAARPTGRPQGPVAKRRNSPEDVTAQAGTQHKSRPQVAKRQDNN